MTIDEQGFITIKGRAKRFAKIGGEMISLAAVEALASELWPDALSAVVAVPDLRKGERLILFTQQKDATRSEFSGVRQAKHASDLMIPSEVWVLDKLPRARHRQGRHDGREQAGAGALAAKPAVDAARRPDDVGCCGGPPLPARLQAHRGGGVSALQRCARWRAAARRSRQRLRRPECDHLVFCGANRFGSAVQWLTQWPVTAEAVGVFTPGERDALFVQYVNHRAARAADSPTRPTSRGAANPPSARRSRCWSGAARATTASASSAR